MRKLLFLFVFLFAGIVSNAQFINQSTGFPQVSVGIGYISAVDQNILWATGYDGVTLTNKIQVFTRTNDGGTNWTPGTIPGYSTYGVSMINAVDFNTAWVAMYAPSPPGGGVILKTTDGGTTWNEQSTATFNGSAGFPNVVHFWNADEGFCMGDPNGGYFEIYTTTDGGNNWVRVPQANIPANLSTEYGTVGYYSVVGNIIWFGTTKGRVFKSIDKGLNWTVSTVSSAWAGVSVNTNFLNANHGVAHHKGAGTTGATGEKYETFDGGTTWSLINQSGPIYLHSFAWVPGLPNTMVATGADNGNSGIAYSPDGGHTWTDFDDTISNYQFLATAWVDNTHGWGGSFTDQTNPATVGGMWKYDGVLTDILNIDPKQGGVKIYPNPGDGRFTCAIIGFENKDVTIRIYNAVGQKVYENKANQSLISYNQHIDLSQLGSGLYIVQIQSGTKVLTQKLTIR